MGFFPVMCSWIAQNLKIKMMKPEFSMRVFDLGCTSALRLKMFPVNLCRTDPHYPIILGGLGNSEGNVGYVQVGPFAAYLVPEALWISPPSIILRSRPLRCVWRNIAGIGNPQVLRSNHIFCRVEEVSDHPTLLYRRPQWKTKASKVYPTAHALRSSLLG